VQFSVLYQLRHNACSITVQNSVSPTRLSGSPSLPSYAPLSANGAAAEDGGRGYVTPHRSSSGNNSIHAKHAGVGLNQRRPPASSSAPRSPLLASWSPNPTPKTTVHSSSQPASSTPLLSTMDKRELSKVVVRDAVYARVLDLVPGRQHVQVAVWTLSPHIIQIDGAVAVCAVPRDAPVGHTTVIVNDPCKWTSSFPAAGAADVRRVLRERLREIALDSSFFASLLKPYLGDVGCEGDIVTAAVDGVQC
jgi:hypothetical protein